MNHVNHVDAYKKKIATNTLTDSNEKVKRLLKKRLKTMKSTIYETAYLTNSLQRKQDLLCEQERHMENGNVPMANKTQALIEMLEWERSIVMSHCTYSSDEADNETEEQIEQEVARARQNVHNILAEPRPQL